VEQSKGHCWSNRKKLKCENESLLVVHAIMFYRQCLRSLYENFDLSRITSNILDTFSRLIVNGTASEDWKYVRYGTYPELILHS